MSTSSFESLGSVTVDEFLTRAGERSPTPGGGAVAALTAGLAVSMGRMVVAYSLGKQQSADDERRIEEVAAQLQRLDGLVRRMVDEDAAAYQNLVAASRDAKKTGGDAGALQSAVKLASAVPLELSAMTVNLVQLLERNKDLMNKRLCSDLAVAAHLGVGACHAADENVRINAAELGSEEDRREALEHSTQSVQAASSLAEQIIAYVHR